jgi:hypothetical protein
MHKSGLIHKSKTIFNIYSDNNVQLNLIIKQIRRYTIKNLAILKYSYYLILKLATSYKMITVSKLYNNICILAIIVITFVSSLVVVAVSHQKHTIEQE